MSELSPEWQDWGTEKPFQARGKKLYEENCDRAREYFSSRRSSYFLKKSNPGSNFNLGNIYWGVLISPKISTGEYLFRGVHFYGDTGIDTNIYEAHSCRAASSSKAKQIRISVPEIFKRGCWSTNSIFKKILWQRYNKQQYRWLSGAQEKWSDTSNIRVLI